MMLPVSREHPAGAIHYRGPEGELDYAVYRVALAAGANGGAHLLEASEPVGLQVIGYGRFTSYQYPGGLNLNLIAPPPPEVIPK